MSQPFRIRRFKKLFTLAGFTFSWYILWSGFFCCLLVRSRAELAVFCFLFKVWARSKLPCPYVCLQCRWSFISTPKRQLLPVESIILEVWSVSGCYQIRPSGGYQSKLVTPKLKRCQKIDQILFLLRKLKKWRKIGRIGALQAARNFCPQSSNFRTGFLLVYLEPSYLTLKLTKVFQNKVSKTLTVKNRGK